MDGGTRTEEQSPNNGHIPLNNRPTAATVQMPPTGSDPRLAWSRHTPKSP